MTLISALLEMRKYNINCCAILIRLPTTQYIPIAAGMVNVIHNVNNGINHVIPFVIPAEGSGAS